MKKMTMLLCSVIMLVCGILFVACGKTEDESDVELKKLSAPTNVKVYYDELRWDSVVNANGYMVDVAGLVISNIQGTSYSSFNQYLTTLGEYTIKIKAQGDNENFSDSDWVVIQYDLVSKSTEYKPQIFLSTNGNDVIVTVQDSDFFRVVSPRLYVKRARVDKPGDVMRFEYFSILSELTGSYVLGQSGTAITSDSHIFTVPGTGIYEFVLIGYYNFTFSSGSPQIRISPRVESDAVYCVVSPEAPQNLRVVLGYNGGDVEVPYALMWDDPKGTAGAYDFVWYEVHVTTPDIYPASKYVFFIEGVSYLRSEMFIAIGNIIPVEFQQPGAEFLVTVREIRRDEGFFVPLRGLMIYSEWTDWVTVTF